MVFLPVEESEYSLAKASVATLKGQKSDIEGKGEKASVDEKKVLVELPAKISTAEADEAKKLTVLNEAKGTLTSLEQQRDACAVLLEVDAVAARLVLPPRRDDVQRQAAAADVVDARRLLGEDRRFMKSGPHCHHQFQLLGDRRQRGRRRPRLQRIAVDSLDVVHEQLGDERDVVADLLAPLGEPFHVIPGRGHPLVQVADCFSPLERAVLAYTDALVTQSGRVADGVFDALRAELSDEQILELTYITSLYDMHATMCRALRLEYDDRDEPIVEIPAPEGFSARDIGRDISRPE